MSSFLLRVERNNLSCLFIVDEVVRQRAFVRSVLRAVLKSNSKFEIIALYDQIGLIDDGRTETNNAAIRVTDKRDETVFPKKSYVPSSLFSTPLI